MKKDNDKNEYITKNDLTEQTQILLTALDERFDKMERKFESKLVNEIGGAKSELRSEMKDMENRLERKIDKVQNSIDGYVKEQEDFKDEFSILDSEVRQIKKVIKGKLGVEISAA